MEFETLDFDPEVTASEPETLDFDPTPAVPMDTPTAEELEKYSKPDPARTNLKQEFKQPDPNLGFTQEEQATIPLGDMTAEETVQFNREQNVADQYKDYQSGPNAGKSLGDDFEVTTDMYEKSENPQRLYELLQEQSDGRDLTGQKTYKGRVIPAPQNYAGVNPTGSMTGLDLAADTIRDSSKNTIVTLAATFDELANAAGIQSNLAEKANANIANAPKAEKFSHALTKDAMRITASVIAGNKAGTMVGNRAGQTSLNTKLIAATAALAVETLTNNPDDPTLVTGDNALVELMQGVPIDENGRYSEQILAKKLNQLTDTIITAGPFAAAADGIAKGTSVAKRIVVNAFSDVMPGAAPRMEKRLAREMLEAFGVGDEEGVAKLQKYLNDHSEEIIKFADGSLDDATIKRSSMSAIAEGAEQSDDFLTANKALQMEKAVEKEGDPALLTLKQQPIREMNKTLESASDLRGGMDAVQSVHQKMADQAVSSLQENADKVTQARSSVDDALSAVRQSNVDRKLTAQTEGDMAVSAAKDILSDAQGEQMKAAKGLSDLYLTDKTFAKTIDQFSKQTGIDVASKFTQKKLDQIVPTMVNSVKKVLDEKDRLYTLPEEVIGDTPSFEMVIQDAVEANAMSPRLQKVLSKEFPELFDNSDEFKEIPFNKMYSKVLPKVNKEIAQEYDKGAQADWNKIDALEAIVENINGTQMDHLAKKYPKYAEQLKQAKEYYKQNVLYYKKSKGSPMGVLFSAYDTAWDDFHGTFDEAGENITGIGKNVEVAEKAKAAVESISDQNPYYSKQVIDFMKNNPQYSGDGSRQLKELVQSEVAGAVSDVLMRNNGDIQKVTPELIYDTLKSKGSVLTKREPGLVRQVNKFIEDFKKAKSNVSKSEEWVKAAKEGVKTAKKSADESMKLVKEENKELLKDAEKAGKKTLQDAKLEKKAADTEVMSSSLGRFILTGKKAPKGAITPKGNPFQTFKEILGKDGNEHTVRDMMQRIRTSGDKAALKEAQAAAIEYLRDSIPSKANPFKMTPSATSRLLSDRASLKTYGKEIFADSPEDQDTWEGMIKLIQLVDKEAKKESSTTLSLQTGQKMENESKKAFGRIMDMLMQKLNPVSMRIRSGGSTVIENASISEMRDDILSAMHSDPKYLSDLFETVKAEAGRKGSSELKRALVLSGILVGRNQLKGGIEDLQEDEKEYFKEKIPEGVKLKSADAGGNFKGLLEKGNIDLAKRPKVKLEDGYDATVRSMSFEEDGKEILVPTIGPNGEQLSDDEAIELYHKTGKHLGKFKTSEDATAYAEKLHKAQEEFYK